MSGGVPTVAWYRFRATFKRRWGGYLSIVLLVGLLGGLAMGSIAAARRTQSSFPTYAASTNPPDLEAITAVLNPLIGSNTGFNPGLIRTLAHLPHVTQVQSASGIDVLPLGPDGAPVNSAGFGPPAAGNGLGSVDGLYFDQARVSIVSGRMADPTRADQMLMQTAVAQAAGVHVGETVPLGIYTNAQTQLPGFGTKSVKPYRRMNVKLVGTFVEAQQLVEDDVDNSQSLFLFTPAFTRPLVACCGNYTATGIQVAAKNQVAVVSGEVQQVLPKQFPAPNFASLAYAKAERAIKPESIALGVFGGIVALAALLIAGQVIGRRLRMGATDLEALRALGASPAMTTADGLPGILGSVALGSGLAVAVAVGLSPLSPIGPVRPVYPYSGVAFDWTVLGLGLLVLILGLGALTVTLAHRMSPGGAMENRRGIVQRGSALTRVASASGLPPPAVAGVRFALEPGVGRNAVPVRSAILGAAVAVIIVVATVTFSASLHSLVSQPALYGWNWDYVLSAGGGSGNIPQQPSTQLLNHDHYVRAWSNAYFDDLVIDGQTVPVLGESPNAAVQPPILSGHALQSADQVVLGAISLAQLHKHVGDSVVLRSGTGTSTSLRIVGIATMPTIGGPGPHLEMGTGAVVSYTLIPVAARNPFNDPVTGPESIFLDLRPGVDPKAALRSLQQIANPLSNNFNFGVFVGSVLRPAEIVNYRSMGTTPAVLGGTLAVGAVSALGLTLVASVRRRQRDLALMKTFGFTRRQLATTVACQSSLVVVFGTVIGVPLGIILGRGLWTAFASQIHAVPSPTVPVGSISLIALGAVLLANIIAAFPALVAARTPTALLLRAE